MTTEEMNDLIRGVSVKAEQIRLLHAAGASRSDIARHLGIRYQHVHNVLKRCGLLEGEQVAPAPRDDVGDSSPGIHVLTIDDAGRVALPREYLEREGIGAGDILVCRVSRDGLHLSSRSAAVEALKEAINQRMPENAALLDALIGASRSP